MHTFVSLFALFDQLTAILFLMSYFFLHIIVGLCNGQAGNEKISHKDFFYYIVWRQKMRILFPYLIAQWLLSVREDERHSMPMRELCVARKKTGVRVPAVGSQTVWEICHGCFFWKFLKTASCPNTMAGQKLFP